MSSNVCEPNNLREATSAMRDGGRIVIRGVGTAADWGGDVSAVGTTVSTAALTGVVAYNPADMTVAVRAGTRVRDLQAELARHGQWIANDAARVGLGATVGGLLATADTGPRHCRYGPVRDVVLGATVVLADGTVSTSGGHVIKNVAGYDLPKLFVGSLGTLGLLAEVVLRTHPLPAVSQTVALTADLDTALRLADELSRKPVEPTAVTWTGGRLLVRFEGTEVGVAEQVAKVAQPGGNLLRGDDEVEAWQADADLVTGSEGETVVRVGALPSSFATLARLIDTVAAEHAAQVVCSANLTSGVHVFVIRGADCAAHAAVVSGLWRGCPDATTTLRRRVPGLTEQVGAWGPPPDALHTLRAVKRAFDPGNRLGPGKFAPWWGDDR